MTEALKVATVRQPVRQIPFLLRVVWFFVLGWELALLWILVAWALNLSIVGLPLGIWMIDRVPQVLTLKARPGAYVINGANGAARFLPDRQPHPVLRAVYFIVVGWWLSFFWALVGWLLCATIIGLPLGVPMLNVLPFVTTLHS